MTSFFNRGLFAAAAGAHVVITALVWKDIGHRSLGDLRGSRTLWRVVTAANTGGSVLYLLLGRRRAA